MAEFVRPHHRVFPGMLYPVPINSKVAFVFKRG